MKRKLDKKMITLIITWIVTFSLLVVSSFAWLHSNYETTSNNINMYADTSSNLVISKSIDFNNVSSYVDWEGTLAHIFPATHTDFVNGNMTGLSCKDSNSYVDASTGLQTGRPPVLHNVVPEKLNDYSYDFVVYLSSTGKAISNATLTVNISSPSGSSVPNYYKATSIDFYIDEVSSVNYKGTLNVAGVNYAQNCGAYNPSATLINLNLLTNARIPCQSDSSGQKYIKVIMRCYFDGALQNSATSTYVTTQNLRLVLSQVNLGVNFSVISGDDSLPN